MKIHFPLSLLILIGLIACKKQQETPIAPVATPAVSAPAVALDPKINTAMLALFAPLPAEMSSDANPITPEKVMLGKSLYYEKRFSKNQELSCNSCHKLDAYGVDNLPTSPGHKGQMGSRNSPTVYNAAGHFAQFWDGRAPTVEEQAKGPILNPVEMAMPSADHVISVLKSIPQYAEAFAKAFPGESDPVTYDNVGKAIGAFERTLTTPSAWDSYLAGDHSALTDKQKAGFNKFIETGCTTCHMGAFVGGQMFQKAGLVKPWPSQADQGRFEQTKNEADRMMFKVPSLRNITKTAPYFHDGSVKDLNEAVKIMARHQLGRELSDDDAGLIVSWLESLTGPLPTEKIAVPAVYPSTETTPKADSN